MGQKIPDISIEEALDLYLSIAFPQGLPEGSEGDKIREALKKKIIKDRPEWAKASGEDNQQEHSETTNYSQIKQERIDQSRLEDIPEDPEEKYLYLRRKEAIENREKKQEEEHENQRKDKVRKTLIEQKQAEDESTIKRAALIKKVILGKVKERMIPGFGESQTNENVLQTDTTNLSIPQSKPVSFSDSEQYSKQSNHSEQLTNQRPEKPNPNEWFKGFKSLSMEDRVKSVHEYNMKKREALHTKEELVRPKTKTKKTGFSLEEKVDRDSHLNFSNELSFGSSKDKNQDFKLS